MRCGYCFVKYNLLCSTSILQISGRTCNIMKIIISRFALLNIGILNLICINRTHTIVS